MPGCEIITQLQFRLLKIFLVNMLSILQKLELGFCAASGLRINAIKLNFDAVG